MPATVIEISETAAATSLIQGEIARFYRAGGKQAEIAFATGLHEQTVGRIHYGETRAPRQATVLAILGFFGFRIRAHRGD